MSTSGIDLDEWLVSDSNCRLVFLGIFVTNLAVLPCSLIQLTSWASSHLPASASVVTGKFLVRLQVMLLTFMVGMFSVFGVLWSILCSTSKGMTLPVAKMYQNLTHASY